MVSLLNDKNLASNISIFITLKIQKTISTAKFMIVNDKLYSQKSFNSNHEIPNLYEMEALIKKQDFKQMKVK